MFRKFTSIWTNSRLISISAANKIIVKLLLQVKSDVRSIGLQLISLTEQVQGMSSSMSVVAQVGDTEIPVKLPVENATALTELEEKLKENSLMNALVRCASYNSNHALSVAFGSVEHEHDAKPQPHRVKLYTSRC